MFGFGNFMTATVATVGLNPSKKEFLDRRGALLVGQHRRLETLDSLGLKHLNSGLPLHEKRIFDACIKYFNGSTAYPWFKKFSPILSKLQVSYENGSACHLDFSQTATDPVWSGLTKDEKRHYIDHESWVIKEQLESHQIKKILLNGMGVINLFNQILGGELVASTHTALDGKEYKFFTGVLNLQAKSIEVRGWNINLQSSYGVSNAMVDSIANLC